MALIAPALYDRLVALRRELHRYPELSRQEARTAEVISRFLQDLGIHHRTNIAGYGVVADIPGDSGVPCVVLRADMDALPIQEETGLEFASVHGGVMHACGHDGHTTMLLGAAALLSLVFFGDRSTKITATCPKCKTTYQRYSIEGGSPRRL